MDPPSVLFLNSNQSLKFFPDNSSDNFTNSLPSAISVDPELYEVGLSEIFYTPNKQRIKFFENDNERQISVTCFSESTNVETFNVKKEDNDLANWLLTANLELAENEANVEILEEILVDDTSHVTLINNNPTKLLTVPKSIAQVLGFFINNFEPGEHKATATVNPSLFPDIEEDEDILFELRPIPNEVNVLVDEPQNYKFEDVIKNINLSLLPSKVQLQIRQDESAVTSETSKTRLKLSKRLASTLGLPTLFFTNNGVYRQSTVVQWTPEPQMLCIASDLIHPISYGSMTVNWMRILSQSREYGRMQHVTLNPIIYHPLNKSFITSVNINITDEFLNQYHFGSQAVTVSLSFRRRGNDVN